MAASTALKAPHLVRPGETDPLAGGQPGSRRSATPTMRVVRMPIMLADLQEIDTVGNGVLVQCV